MRFLLSALVLAGALLLGASVAPSAPLAAPLAQATATPTPRVVGTGYTRTDQPDSVRCYEYHESGQVAVSCLVVE